MRRLFAGALLLAACGEAPTESADQDEIARVSLDAGYVLIDGGVRSGGRALDAQAGARGENEPPGSRLDGSADSASPGALDDPNAPVPVFVAVGYGTRRTVSCDLGRSWLHEEQDVAGGGDDVTLARGLAAGAGKFVATVGGLGVQVLLTSDDGVRWTRLARSGNGYSDVAYGKSQFVAGGGHISAISSDGYNWGQEGAMGTGSSILRHLAYGASQGGRFVAVGDSGRRMTSDDGVLWRAEVEEGETLIGVAYGAATFVAISAGANTRYSEDGGDSWQSGEIAGATGVRGILYDGRRFIVTTRGNTFTSSDGKSWQSHPASGGPQSFDVSDDGQHYAGAADDVLYHSSDGLQFEVVGSGGQALTRVKFQRVKPSAACPR